MIDRRVFKYIGIFLSLTFIFSSCGGSNCFNAGGQKICVGENATFVQGKNGVWEIPGKYKFECKGVFMNDVDLPTIEDLKDPSGNVVFDVKGDFLLVYELTNLGYSLTEKDKESKRITKSGFFEKFDLNDGKEITIRPYPYEDNDYKYDEISLNYQFPAIEKGESTGDIFEEFVTDRVLDMDNDVLVFTMFFNDGQQVHEAVFEMELSSLEEFFKEND